MPLTFGKGTHPPFTDRLIPNAQTSTCQHSMAGFLWWTAAIDTIRRAPATAHGPPRSLPAASS